MSQPVRRDASQRLAAYRSTYAMRESRRYTIAAFRRTVWHMTSPLERRVASTRRYSHAMTRRLSLWCRGLKRGRFLIRSSCGQRACSEPRFSRTMTLILWFALRSTCFTSFTNVRSRRRPMGANASVSVDLSSCHAEEHRVPVVFPDHCVVVVNHVVRCATLCVKKYC